MAAIPRKNTGLSGEYFVAAELYRRGWSVGMTIGNAKAVDLFAEKVNKLFAIQVKAIYQKKNVGWPITKDKIKKDCFYIFVNLNADKMEQPEYFICTSKEADENIKEYKERGIVNRYLLNNEMFLGCWEKLEF
mgnify:FL=1